MGKVNLTINTIVDEKLTEDNYEYWKACLRNYLIGKGLWRVVSGKESKPEDKNDERYEDWKQKNSMALHAIQMSCGADVYQAIKKKNTTAHEAWILLAEKLHQQRPLPDDEEGTKESTGTSFDFLQYRELREAVDAGNWKATVDFLERYPHAINARISGKGDTALHLAIMAGHAWLAEALVEKMEAHDLEKMSDSGWTALALAAVKGHIMLAKAIVTKNAKTTIIGSPEETIGSGEDGGFIPLIYASFYGQKEMASYLYSQTPIEILSPDAGISGPLSFNALINPEIYDVALDLLQKHPLLAFTKDYYGNYGIRLVARKASGFPSGLKLPSWKHWIYLCIPIPPVDATTKYRKASFCGSVDEENARGPQKSSTDGVSMVSRVPGIKHLYDRKLVHKQHLMLLQCMLENLTALQESKLQEIDIDEALFIAVEEGIVEFIVQMMKFMPEIIWREDGKGRSIFANAIVLRQELIFCLIYGLGTKTSMLARRHDKFANNFLHLAAKLAPTSQLDHASGAAMQMQRELQWFKEVEGIVQVKYKEEANDHNKTPRALFTEEHKDLLKEGERWMKNTAASCMVVATLIAAVMFTTTFTPPGGSTTTGVPIFLGSDAFMVFVISNALSLFSSSTSMLMFLGILTSRYAEEDFLKELPSKLGIGLFSLFFSVATMMAAFSSALFIILHERLAWVSLPIAVFALIPITLFALLEFPLLVMMLLNTYGCGIFNRNLKHLY